MATDPVCGMYVDERSAELVTVRDNRSYYFCSRGCLDTFVEPHRRLRTLHRKLLIAWPASALVLILTYAVSGSWVGYAAFALATVVQFYAGSDFYRGFLDAIRNRSPNMDVLIASGTTAAYAYSTAALFLPTGLPPVYYFDASTLIVTLILTGNYIEFWTRSRAGSALRRLGELVPPVAHRWRLGLEQDVPVSELTVGETVRVRPGERLPVDGTILSGTSEIDNSLLTGEATPEPRGPGDSVWAGTSNGRGILEVQVGKVGPDTFLAHLQELMTDAELNQVPVQKFADRVASAFVPVVLALGVLAAVGWYAFGGASGTVALLIFVSVVITACPCAFGIATPAAVIVATGRAAESGVLFKGRDAIERTGAVDVVLADKTGTLTLGRPRLKEVVVAPGWTKEDVLRLAAAVELGSEHPLARAVVEAARAEGAAVGVASEVVAQPGIGIYGTVDGATVEVRLLSASAETEGTTGLSPDPTAHFAREGWTSSVVSVGGKPAGWLGFEDPVRPEVPAAVAELGELGLEVMVVSGDNEAAVSRAARDAGIVEFRSRIRPDDKVRLVEEVQARNHRVAFVGDGLNDAAALTAAYAGIAVGTGTDVTKEAGRVILVRPDFRGVPLAVRTARSTLRKIRQNIFWAIGYNAFLLPIAAGILVPWTGFSVYAILPVTGAIAMGISSTTVLLNSLSLRRIPSPKGLPRTPGSSRDAIPA